MLFNGAQTKNKASAMAAVLTLATVMAAAAPESKAENNGAQPRKYELIQSNSRHVSGEGAAGRR
jgi:hypothetical protein